jgi:hypothetical protein
MKKTYPPLGPALYDAIVREWGTWLLVLLALDLMF